jgi:hypothetical protein
MIAVTWAVRTPYKRFGQSQWIHIEATRTRRVGEYVFRQPARVQTATVFSAIGAGQPL